MCFDLDSLPPVPVIAGAAISHRDLTLSSANCTDLAAFAALPDDPSGIVVLPDVRGLYRFYEELADDSAEAWSRVLAFISRHAGCRSALGADERLVLDPVRLESVRAPGLLHPRGVVGPASLEPDRLAISLEGEDVRRDTVEEPAIVGDDHSAAREVEEGIFERTQGVDVEVVRGLVEEQDVAARAEKLREVHAVALTA